MLSRRNIFSDTSNNCADCQKIYKKIKIAWSAPGLQAAILWQTLLLALILIAKDLSDEQVVFLCSI